MSNPSALDRAIEVLGSQSALARAIGVKPQAVQFWVRSGRVPAERVVAVESATNGAVKRAELRPDLFTEAA